MMIKSGENKAWAVTVRTQYREYSSPSTSNVHNFESRKFSASGNILSRFVCCFFLFVCFFPPGKRVNWEKNESSETFPK